MAELRPVDPLPAGDVEARLAWAARDFPYPPTPDLAPAAGLGELPLRRSPTRRGAARMRLLLAGALLALLLAAIFAVPPVRAAVLDWIRIGAVRIFLVRPSPTPVPTSPPGTATALPVPSATPLASVLDIQGETSLAAAREKAGFPLQLPAGLGPPDRVYVQDLAGPVVILVWMEQANPGQVKLALSETDAQNIIFQKMLPSNIEDTTVNGQPAKWMDGPYLLVTGSGDTSMTRLVTSGHTLVWTAGKLTFRLETGLGMDEARRIAASIR